MNAKQFIITALGVVLIGYTAGTALADQPAPGSSNDPLVTKSYVDKYINDNIGSLEKEVQSLKAKVAQLEGQLGTGSGSNPGTPVNSGQTAVLKIGSKTATIGSKTVQLDTAPFIVQNTTMLPFAFVGQVLGANVGWVKETKTVTFQTSSTKIELKIGSKTATVNGRTVQTDVAPSIVNNRTLVPLRFVSANLGATVEWNSAAKTIKITP
ncbi:copper amine oxidase N-terminal domain-containing protein [Bacillota bacterium LX-D]|nr:copper amine oxidase N-terminal domain-containing protein [Bacillota bacterium LX-D]